MNIKIFTDDIEDAARAQCETIMSTKAFKDEKVRIMPDVHAGAGCVIGFTSTYTPGKAIIPNVLGVDLNCGVEARNYGKIKVDNNFFKNLDKTINEKIPSGRKIQDRILIDFNLNQLKCARHISKRNYVLRSIGTLGGGKLH